MRSFGTRFLAFLLAVILTAGVFLESRTEGVYAGATGFTRTGMPPAVSIGSRMSASSEGLNLPSLAGRIAQGSSAEIPSQGKPAVSTAQGGSQEGTAQGNSAVGIAPDGGDSAEGGTRGDSAQTAAHNGLGQSHTDDDSAEGTAGGILQTVRCWTIPARALRGAVLTKGLRGAIPARTPRGLMPARA